MPPWVRSAAPLVWNATVAASAQRWADKCQVGTHSHSKLYGENIGEWGGGTWWALGWCSDTGGQQEAAPVLPLSTWGPAALLLTPPPLLPLPAAWGGPARFMTGCSWAWDGWYTREQPMWKPGMGFNMQTG